MSSNGSPADDIRSQWQNPGDIFSLLLLIGGDVVQKAIARLVGVHVKVLWTGSDVFLTPVAFSFGWVAYAFMSLSSVLGDHRLMPEPDTDIQVINCNNGYVRNNNSWVLGRLLRDKQASVAAFRRVRDPPPDSTGEVSLLIEVFDARNSSVRGALPSKIWWWGWVVILAQHGLAIAPWIKWGDWSTFLITICGTALALLTAGLPQWRHEKWSAERLASEKVKTVALTKGNGHQYVMVVRGYPGTWDLEQMASGRERDVPGTRRLLSLFAALWVVLLITVTGLKEHTWFLVGVGGIGMLQNVIVSAVPSTTQEFDIDLHPYPPCPTIVGYQYTWAKKDDLRKNHWKQYTDDDAANEFKTRLEDGSVRDVMGALMELEKFHQNAGAALLPVFFPGSVDYEPSLSLNNREKRFWKAAIP